MGKLAERLADQRRSGVYRVEVTEALEEAAGIVGLGIVSFPLRGVAADRLLASCVRAVSAARLESWDALAAAFAEPACAAGPGRVLLFVGFEDLLRRESNALEPLIAALQSAAARHRLEGRRFFAVFLDPTRALAIDPLYDRRRHSAMSVSADTATATATERDQ
jgi:hypothetical protein